MGVLPPGERIAQPKALQGAPIALQACLEVCAAGLVGTGMEMKGSLGLAGRSLTHGQEMLQWRHDRPERAQKPQRRHLPLMAGTGIPTLIRGFLPGRLPLPAIHLPQHSRHCKGTTHQFRDDVVRGSIQRGMGTGQPDVAKVPSGEILNRRVRLLSIQRQLPS